MSYVAGKDYLREEKTLLLNNKCLMCYHFDNNGNDYLTEPF